MNAIIEKRMAPPSISDRYRGRGHQGGFGGFSTEKENAVRIPEVKMESRLEALFNAWRMIERRGQFFADDYPELRALMANGYTAGDIERFSLLMVALADTKNFENVSGSFLSSMIRHCQGNEFSIHTAQLGQVHGISIPEGKKLTVFGDAGACLGQRMKGGLIIVKGNAGNGLGFSMEGGSILIEGNAESGAGHDMRGGLIFIRGNAQDDIGSFMQGGDIRVWGTVGKLSFNFFDATCGGRIFQKDVQLHKEGTG